MIGSCQQLLQTKKKTKKKKQKQKTNKKVIEQKPHVNVEIAVAAARRALG
jgi:hypothetical protein